MTDEQTSPQNQPEFRMQKMYLKDLSFESPNAPQVFLQQNQSPKVDFHLKLANHKVDDDHWEVSLAITAKILDRNNKDAVLFMVEVEHAAVFLLRHIPEEHVERILAIDCPFMLFPFTRQIVSQLSLDGGFTPFLMEPINFIALYENRTKQQEQ